jgi:hypothetical protein
MDASLLVILQVLPSAAQSKLSASPAGPCLGEFSQQAERPDRIGVGIGFVGRERSMLD